MAKSKTTARRLSDWVVLAFVLLVTGLLVAGLVNNVRDAAGHRGSTTDAAATVQPDSDRPTTH